MAGRRIAAQGSTGAVDAKIRAALKQVLRRRPKPQRGKSPKGQPQEGGSSPSSECRVCRLAPGAVALRQLQDEVPGVTNEATTGLEQPLLEARQRPALDGDGQDQPAQEIAEIVGNDPEEQAHFVGPEPMAGEPGPVGGGLALLDPLLGRPASVIR